MDIANYRERLNSYETEINAFSDKIAEAQKNLIVAQTKIESHENEIKRLTKECKAKFGVKPEELDNLIQENVNELDKIIMQVREVQNAGNNPGSPVSDTIAVAEEEEVAY